MIKLKFVKIDNSPRVRWDFVSMDIPLPLSVTIGLYDSLPTTIYARNISNENFLELRFDRDHKNLYEISIVSVQESGVAALQHDRVPLGDESIYRCVIEEADSVLDGKMRMQVERRPNLINIKLIKEDQGALAYFAIGKGCYIGVDAESVLSSVVLISPIENSVESIFGK